MIIYIDYCYNLDNFNAIQLDSMRAVVIIGQCNKYIY